MKRNDFLEYLKDPSNIPFGATSDLDDISRMFPWFQGAKILLCKALKNGGDIRFSEALKDAALNSGDRKQLHRLINAGVSQTSESLIPIALSQKPESNSENNKNEFDSTDDVTQQELSGRKVKELNLDKEISTDDINEDKSTVGDKHIIEHENKLTVYKSDKGEDERGETFLEWLKKLRSNNAIPVRKENDLSAESVVADEKDFLVERFIQTAPRISKPDKQEFFSPSNMAKKSVEDREDIVSETLARIFEAQGDFRRAIRIYQKLSLLNPGKSAYFAALIEKLDNTLET